MPYCHAEGMGIDDPKLPDELASVIRSEIDAWIADLTVIGRDSRGQKFVELQARLFPGDSDIVGPLGRGGLLGRPMGLPVLDNVLSALKADDLEDLVVPAPPAGPG